MNENDLRTTLENLPPNIEHHPSLHIIRAANAYTDFPRTTAFMIFGDHEAEDERMRWFRGVVDAGRLNFAVVSANFLDVRRTVNGFRWVVNYPERSGSVDEFFAADVHPIVIWTHVHAGDAQVGVTAARHRNAPEGAVAVVLARGEGFVSGDVPIPLGCVGSLTGSEWGQRTIARNLLVGSGALRALVPSASVVTLVEILSNPSANAETISLVHERLLGGAGLGVADGWLSELRRLVAMHARAPRSVLAELARDASAEVRMVVAGHWNAPADALRRLAVDECDFVRAAALGNACLPLDVWDSVVFEGESVRVLVGAVRNTCVPAGVLDRIVGLLRMQGSVSAGVLARVGGAC